MQRSDLAIGLAVLLAIGCGSGPSATEETADTEPTSGDEGAEPDDGAQITGLMGTIRRDEVEAALQPRVARFMRCFEQRMGDVEFLSGSIRMSFRIHTDGSVAWVYPAESDIGDRQAEQCVLDLARSTRFARPRGGEAEFSWGFGFDAPDDVRPPLNWTEGELGRQLEEVAEVARECRARGGYRVTAYIEPGGRVLAAGGSAPNHESLEGLDCILERVRAIAMPDPGSYAAKVSFSVD